VHKELGLDRPAKASEAKALLARKLKELGEGAPLSPQAMTLGGFLQQWLSAKQAKVRETTYELYEMQLRLHLLPDDIAQIKLDKLTPLAVPAYVLRLLKRSTPTRTLHVVVSLLWQALNVAVKWGLISRNPASGLDLPKDQPASKKIWSDEEAARFLEAIQGDDLELVYLIAINTGMRRGEILGLTWDRVDFNESALHVAQSLNRKRHMTNPKTANPQSAYCPCFGRSTARAP